MPQVDRTGNELDGAVAVLMEGAEERNVKVRRARIACVPGTPWHSTHGTGISVGYHRRTKPPAAALPGMSTNVRTTPSAAVCRGPHRRRSVGTLPTITTSRSMVATKLRNAAPGRRARRLNGRAQMAARPRRVPAAASAQIAAIVACPAARKFSVRYY